MINQSGTVPTVKVVVDNMDYPPVLQGVMDSLVYRSKILDKLSKSDEHADKLALRKKVEQIVRLSLVQDMLCLPDGEMEKIRFDSVNDGLALSYNPQANDITGWNRYVSVHFENFC